MITVYYALVPIAAMCLLVFFWRLRERKAAINMIAEFAEAFPGCCPVCSFHRYGVLYGYVAVDSRPNPHRCPEAK